MIVATPDGSFFSEVSSERRGAPWRLVKISAEQARHLCKKSQDYVIHRPLTLREKIMALRRSKEKE